MLNRFKNDVIESIYSVMPVTILVLILSLLLKMEKTNVISFLISAILLVIGISLFNFGANLSMVIIGDKIGESLIKKKSVKLILFIGLLIGFVITIAEPDLMVLASQLKESVSEIVLIGTVGLGVGIFILIALLRIIKGIKLNRVILIGYAIVFILLFLTILSGNLNFIAVAFDSGGVTTGPMSVPFIVAFGYGFTKLRTDRNSKNDTFGLVGLASIGPIIVVLLLGLILNVNGVNTSSSYELTGSLLNAYLNGLVSNFTEVCIALTPILVVFLIFEIVNDTVDDTEMRKIILGLITTLLGLSIFLTGASVGFMTMAYKLGGILTNNKLLLVIVGMLIGFFIVKAEPAVKVLTNQVCDLTGGSINKKVINLCLQIGVCVAVGLSLTRLVVGINILYILIPGYLIAILLSFVTPDLFIAVAFDSGGAASGPLTTTFLLPLIIGACTMLNKNILVDAFGMVALVALSPLIMVQILGLVYKIKLHRHDKLVASDLDESIIEFEVSL